MPHDRPGRSDRVGVGILGSGNMARVYATALRDGAGGARLRAVALGSRATALAADFGVDAEPGADALLARPDIDLVIVTTPHSTHAPLALAAAAAGRHVYLEKPMALDVQECDAIIAACDRAGVQLTVAKQTRYFEMSQQAKRLVDAGAIGRLRIIQAMSPFTRWSLADNHWIRDRREGDSFFDWGSHAADAFRWFTGAEVVRVYADFANFSGIPAHDPTAAVQVRMDDGVICQAFLSYELPEPGLGSGSNNQYRLIGSDGMIEWDLDRVRLGGPGGWRTVDELPSWTQPTMIPDHPRRIGNSARQLRAFVSSITGGGAPGVSGADGRAAIEVVQAATRSAASGTAIHLRPQPAIEARRPAEGPGDVAARRLDQ